MSSKSHSDLEIIVDEPENTHHSHSNSWKSVSLEGSVFKLVWAVHDESLEEDRMSGFFEFGLLIVPEQATLEEVREEILKQQLDLQRAFQSGVRRCSTLSEVELGEFTEFTPKEFAYKGLTEDTHKLSISLRSGLFDFLVDGLPVSVAQEHLLSASKCFTQNRIVLSVRPQNFQHASSVPIHQLGLQRTASYLSRNHAPSLPSPIPTQPELGDGTSPILGDTDIFRNEERFFDAFDRAIQEEQRTMKAVVMLQNGTKLSCWDTSTIIEVLQRERTGACWMDISGASESQISEIGRAFKIHPLTIEDCFPAYSTRQKLEPFEHYIFLVVESLHHLCYSPDVENSLRILVFKDCLISFHQYPLLGISAARDRLNKVFRSGYKKVMDTMDILHAVLDSILDLDVPMVHSMGMEAQNLEDLVFVLGSVERTDVLKRMGLFRRKLSTFRQQLWPKRDIMQSLVDVDNVEFLKASHVAYFRDIYDHILVMLNKLEMSSELLSTLESTYLAKVSIEVSVISNNMNEVMKRFNSVATIVLPLTFVTGLFGMNVTVPGQTGLHGENLGPFFMIVGLMAFSTVALLLWFKRNQWV